MYLYLYQNIKYQYVFMYYYYNSNITKVMSYVYFNGVILFVTRYVNSLELFPSNENVMNIIFDK